MRSPHFGLVAGAFLLAVAPLGRARAQVAGGDGYLVGVPNGSVTFRGGWALASASSDLFSFTTNNLTLSKRDFSSPTVGADVAFRLHPRTDLVFSATWAGMNKSSEFRKYIDNNNLPIEQRTSFDRVPLTVSLKYYLVDRGRSIGRLAWIPTRIAPYIGAGGGAEWYRFQQQGDFVDFQSQNLDVFGATLESHGWAPTAHAYIGAEFSLDPRFAFVTEARYGWSKAPLSGDFTGFDRIDLSGFSTTAGIAVRF
ncbi:MAG: hypothetical protein ABI442_07010 [Gemmatimonadaceae bacterium]